MLGVLLKKQVAEVFRSYFYNRKTGKARSKGGVVMMFVLFGLLLFGILGGTFTFLSLGLCAGLVSVGMGWLYYVLMSGIAVTLGAFGSVFNTYSGLYLPKDNDLLLSMPIPVRTIITSRLLNVYLLGALYSGVVMLPALIVRWAVAGATAANVVGGIVLFLIISILVLILSCLLGLVVARVSLKLKNKSFITVLIALAFIGVYYLVYFRAQSLIRDIVENAVAYGTNIKSSAYVLYMFGSIGEGDLAATAVFAAATAALLALTVFILSRSFLKLATSSGSSKKVRYVERRAKERSAFRALLSKEFARLASSPNYMLNCALGVIVLPALGVFMLIKGAEICELLKSISDASGVIFCAALMLAASMIATAIPSVSLEGKSLWIPQSLPVDPKTVLKAKTAVQLILTELPMLFASVCAAIAVQSSVAEKVMVAVLPLVFGVFTSLFDMFLGVRSPMLVWTSEIIPIKQSGAALVAVFGCWGLVLLFGAAYILIGGVIGAAAYLAIWTVIYAVADVLLYRWICTKGATAFSKL